MIDWQLDFCVEVGDFRSEYKLSWQQDLNTLEGQSGAGKTTLLECLLGLRRQEQISGRARVNDILLFDTELGFNLAVEKRPFAWVPQDALLLPHLTVSQNILLGRKDKQGGFALDHLLETLGLRTFTKRMPRGLSGGERQRVALARALYSEKPILLMDEPLSGVGQTQKRVILADINTALGEYPRAVVFVSHAQEDFEAFEQPARLGMTTIDGVQKLTFAPEEPKG